MRKGGRKPDSASRCFLLLVAFDGVEWPIGKNIELNLSKKYILLKEWMNFSKFGVWSCSMCPLILMFHVSLSQMFVNDDF